MEVTIDHVVLEVRDVPRALAFYRDVLGFAPVREEEFLAGDAPFASARVSDATVIDFFPPRLWRDRERPENPNHVCFTMPKGEVAALRKRLGAEGVEIIRERENNFGAKGLGNSIYFGDPEGIELEAKYHEPSG